MQNQSSMSETETAFAERTIRSEKRSLPLRGTLWVQVPSQSTALCHFFEF